MKKTITREAALAYHEFPFPGKIEIMPSKPYSTQRDLSLAYSPGVAYPCEAIKENPDNAWLYTGKGDLVAVISNGTAVLGLGNIGALASKPVMEGKAFLFKIFAGLNSIDIELDTHNVDEFVNIVKAMSPSFGGINLEDIKAPECFEIEKRLKGICDIPIMHDDQHGTAIVTAAGMLNALELQGKKIENVQMVVNGAGSAAVACTEMLISLGMKRNNIVMCDSKGVITNSRQGLTSVKARFATDRHISTLAEAMTGADIFLGLSVKDTVTQDMVRSMASRPIVFALANPDPEIAYDEAVASRDDLIFATGRSDYPNQINNVLCFPYLFRGALDTHSKAINEEMKHAAVYAIAALAHEPVPEEVCKAYHCKTIPEFGPEYILPTAFDPRLLPEVAAAVAQAAMDSKAARHNIADMKAYKQFLQEMIKEENREFKAIEHTLKGKDAAQLSLKQ
ncbi:MAG: NAD-dependent malic enzyme [Ruminococcus sp.]|nr:NAD-dependent malic enzyme [Ruminococcus sp.]